VCALLLLFRRLAGSDLGSFHAGDLALLDVGVAA
jgi:hypothetical protein